MQDFVEEHCGLQQDANKYSHFKRVQLFRLDTWKLVSDKSPSCRGQILMQNGAKYLIFIIGKWVSISKVYCLDKIQTSFNIGNMEMEVAINFIGAVYGRREMIKVQKLIFELVT